MNTKELVGRAIAMRDDSLALITPPLDLDRLPAPLPANVLDLPECVLSKEEIQITSHDACELLEAIRNKKYSCVTVCKAFLRRAALAQSLVRTVRAYLRHKLNDSQH